MDEKELNENEEILGNEDDIQSEEETVVSEEKNEETGEILAESDDYSDIGLKRFTAEAYSWFDTLLHALLAVVIVFTFFTKMSTVDGTSMLPTLEDQQRLMITNFFYKPDYNDIVVVWADFLPNDDGGRGKAIVKRVIGLAGDNISIDYERGLVYRNGEQLPVEFKDGELYEDGHRINTYTNDEEGSGGEFTVPEGHLFVMGDNRNGSTDSRCYVVGYVDERNVIGRAYLRIWPFNRISGLV